jgi:hypothetical protein
MFIIPEEPQVSLHLQGILPHVQLQQLEEVRLQTPRIITIIPIIEIILLRVQPVQEVIARVAVAEAQEFQDLQAEVEVAEVLVVVVEVVLDHLEEEADNFIKNIKKHI